MYFQCHYDQAIIIHVTGKRTPVPKWLRLRHEGTFFSMYDVKDPTSCTGR